MVNNDKRKVAAKKNCDKKYNKLTLKKMLTSSKPVNNLLSRDISC